ncbi:MAG: winged helix-turn-helix domain-containing protein [Bdellovibrionales bacterium]
MPTLFLLIPEPALRDAVIEQIKTAELGDPCVVDSLQDALKQAEGHASAVIVVDAAGAEKKTEAQIQSLNEKPNAPLILMLGGADDRPNVTETFSKPLRLGHLISRLRYYLETAPLLRDRVVAFGPYRLEPQSRRILRDNESEPLRLTEKETALLVFLAQNKNPATRQDILADVWGYDERIDTHTLETHVYQLRRKLDKEGENWLINEAGTYRLAEIKE